MTAQTPERIIIDGRPRALYEQPLYRLLASRRMDLKDPHRSGFHTGCYRRYLGTWEIRNGTLYLVHLNMVVPDEEPLTPLIRQRLFRAVPCTGFPIKAIGSTAGCGSRLGGGLCTAITAGPIGLNESALSGFLAVL